MTSVSCPIVQNLKDSPWTALSLLFMISASAMYGRLGMATGRSPCVAMVALLFLKKEG